MKLHLLFYGNEAICNDLLVICKTQKPEATKFPELKVNAEHFDQDCVSSLRENDTSLLTGRQVKMAYVNSVAKPPRDVRRRQEKFGTQAGASSSSASSAASAPVR